MAEENMHELPNKPWSTNGLDKLIKKIDDRYRGYRPS